MALTSIMSILLLTLHRVGAAIIAPGVPNVPACSPVHILVARGSLESPGTGMLHSLAEVVTRAHPDATVEAIDYPAKIQNYSESVAEGARAVAKQITLYADRCSRSRLVVLGFSQGAHVTGDAICGGDAVETTRIQPLNERIGRHIAAIVWYGDPRHVAGKPYDRGNATTDGAFARPDHQSCDKYAHLIASYCDDGDAFCACTGDDFNVHVTYPQRYDTQAAAFILERLAVVNLGGV